MKSILFIFIFIFSFVGRTTALSDKIYEELETFTQILDLVDKQYVHQVDEHQMIQGAIQGMLSSLDPHTVYMEPDLYKDFKADTTGKYGGVGIEISVKDGVLTVVSPFEDSPAYFAGIKAGDRILKINGTLTKGMNIMDAVSQMRGNKGKKVVLTIWHEGASKAQDITLVRDIIKMVAVKQELIKGGYAYMRITTFQENTTQEMEEALKKVTEENKGPLKGIVLDLRNNPGGLLNEAVGVSDLFMDKGTIVSTRGKDKEIEVKTAKSGSAYENTPLVVLVNGGSASASEIVAGALQDVRRAKIIGTQSFGKGSVQTLLDLGNGSALKITIAKYFTPKGRQIDGKGIGPDIVIDTQTIEKDLTNMPADQRPKLADYQKEKAIEILR
ncbi:MAG: hypothetical protein A3G32_04915 [Deltaproteobacteria bacterium RIFCSPLOWO2_12_FULL_40_28]|nr:MAG: hypothetical protein A3C45_09025 [Deltaproteobacteria bacterium RIFCSPHIGHO2_02_FULL_40_28]OGQ19708.1 MAG: hypothetical protein A3E27_08220 [Deltaproteobacteria bacterium RIFCSPHIGHO2_12_FULL_40_32]OGQ40985.1 MAG: hypothetical protein A3I69_03635 [Deltaproteobacteria bacterium RIFCSPLOWO2_02_FULL_40_36]OGQ54100.1 MAG: hypothetical protein A3G32_04915 [Deltaproteobacteria bacterium RIFCSPLOWO2_12_FULL_40_28]